MRWRELKMILTSHSREFPTKNLLATRHKLFATFDDVMMNMRVCLCLSDSLSAAHQYILSYIIMHCSRITLVINKYLYLMIKLVYV